MDLRKLARWVIGKGATREQVARFIRWWTERPESAERFAKERATYRGRGW